MIAYKFLRKGRISPYSNFQWQPGLRIEVEGGLSMSNNGIHACRDEMLTPWIDVEMWEIELHGEILTGEDKICARGGTLLRQLKDWHETTQRLFAADCALDVLHHFEANYPKDNRPRQAIVTAYQFACGEIDDTARAASSAAARAASRKWQSLRLLNYAQGNAQ